MSKSRSRAPGQVSQNEAKVIEQPAVALESEVK
jgi:hypothetical protein